MRMIFNKELLNEEQALVFQLRQEEKVLLREIAEQMGLSVKRVQQIECEARRRLEEYGENPREGFVLLPTRVRKMLENLEFGSRSEVLAAVQSVLASRQLPDAFLHQSLAQWLAAQLVG